MRTRLGTRLSGLVIAAAACTALVGGATSARQDAATSRLRAQLTDPAFVLFARGPLDTRLAEHLDTSARDLAAGRDISAASTSRSLRVIQFREAITEDSIKQVKAAGVEIVGYIPHNAYLIRGSNGQLSRVAALREGLLRWMGGYAPMLKLAPEFDEGLLRNDRGAPVAVEIEILDTDESRGLESYAHSVALSVDRAPRRFLRYRVLSLTIPASELLNLASFEEVLFVAPSPEFVTHDERGAQIVAGNLTAELTMPSGTGYLEWLAERGLDSDPDFTLDITDTGLDRGSVTLVHPDLMAQSGPSRVAYSVNYWDDEGDDRRGHGSLVTSIAAGGGLTGERDAEGYLYGLGVEPRAKIGVSRIFNEMGRLPFVVSFTNIVSTAYAAGARVSNNSWGAGTNQYNATAREYDALVRDARPGEPGNQQMLLVFSAGNSGPGGWISTPGTAKNVITVAASENYRPEGTDSCNLDGLGGVGPDGADSAMDILRFSSGGPTFDGRSKPDISAPGTHIYGAASQTSPFWASGLCPGVPTYQPPGQRLFTWSSGTSMAAAHISGASVLLRKFLGARLGSLVASEDGSLRGSFDPPVDEADQSEAEVSPALIKAMLINSARYMTGDHANDDLPSSRQGWGLVNLGAAIDNAQRAIVDQSVVFTETGESFEIRGSLADRSRPLLVTLTWTDAPGTPGGAPAVNDLDLEVRVGDALLYLGNNFEGRHSVAGGLADKLNNVECVFLPPDLLPEGFHGNFTITVRASNIAGDGIPGNEAERDQDFALVVYNVTDPIEPPPDEGPQPVITSATFVKKVLTITGQAFGAGAKVEINGTLIGNFEFDAATNSLTTKRKKKKLNLIKGGENSIVVIEGDARSDPFILRF